MKTKIVCIISGLILFSAFCLKAQNFKFGLLAGVDVSNTLMADKPDIEGYSRLYDPMVSFNVNGYIGYKSPGFWGLSLEPGFIRKGGIQRFDKENKDDDVKFQLYYIQIPMLVDFYVCNKLFLSVGPEFAYMINATAKSKDYSNDISEYYDNNFEISGMIGINYSFLENFDIGLRYNHGLSYVSKVTWTDETALLTNESKEYNQYIQIIIRFKI